MQAALRLVILILPALALAGSAAAQDQRDNEAAERHRTKTEKLLERAAQLDERAVALDEQERRLRLERGCSGTPPAAPPWWP